MRFAFYECVAEAVEQAGLAGKIVVTGMATPNQMKEFVKRGTVKTVVLWNPVDLGYLAVYAAQASLAGTLKDNATQAKVPAGRLGTRDAVVSLDDITAKGPLTLKNVIVLGDPRGINCGRCSPAWQPGIVCC
jgi:ABC-type sugar transport system substrate-binding protein